MHRYQVVSDSANSCAYFLSCHFFFLQHPSVSRDTFGGQYNHVDQMLLYTAVYRRVVQCPIVIYLDLDQCLDKERTESTSNIFSLDKTNLKFDLKWPIRRMSVISCDGRHITWVFDFSSSDIWIEIATRHVFLYWSTNGMMWTGEAIAGDCWTWSSSKNILGYWVCVDSQ